MTFLTVMWDSLLSGHRPRTRFNAGVTGLVLVALLSAGLTVRAANSDALTASQGVVDGSSSSVALADPVEAPASLTVPRIPGSTSLVPGSAARVVASSWTNGIPTAALSAYQRAETVINAADRTCALTWQLIAAIGRVESNHGRFGGSVLSPEGLATPGIYGVALDGRDGVALISDTDGGQFDRDVTFDRAVGPLQFIPSTWAVAGVDADGDGVRNPQDVDDAALAAAVYLCSGAEELSTDSAMRSAVLRYNNSVAYVDLVMRVMQNYLAGDFTTIPDGTVAGGYLMPTHPPVPTNAGGTADDSAVANSSSATASTQQPVDEPAQPTPSPTDDAPEPAGPAEIPGPLVVGIEPVDAALHDVDPVLSATQALTQCLLDGVIDNPQTATNELETCVERLTRRDR